MTIKTYSELNKAFKEFSKNNDFSMTSALNLVRKFNENHVATSPWFIVGSKEWNDFLLTNNLEFNLPDGLLIQMVRKLKWIYEIYNEQEEDKTDLVTCLEISLSGIKSQMKNKK